VAGLGPLANAGNILDAKSSSLKKLLSSPSLKLLKERILLVCILFMYFLLWCILKFYASSLKLQRTYLFGLCSVFVTKLGRSFPVVA
jgi:hypothetical protein